MWGSVRGLGVPLQNVSLPGSLQYALYPKGRDHLTFFLEKKKKSQNLYTKYSFHTNLDYVCL